MTLSPCSQFPWDSQRVDAISSESLYFLNKQIWLNPGQEIHLTKYRYTRILTQRWRRQSDLTLRKIEYGKNIKHWTYAEWLVAGGWVWDCWEERSWCYEGFASCPWKATPARWSYAGSLQHAHMDRCNTAITISEQLQLREITHQHASFIKCPTVKMLQHRHKQKYFCLLFFIKWNTTIWTSHSEWLQYLTFTAVLKY